MTQDVSILNAGGVRVFVQEDGINPAAGYIYYGCLHLDSPTQDLGAPDPVYCPSPSKRNVWEIIDDTPKTPALGTMNFSAHVNRFLNDIWFDLKNRGCKFNMQVVAGSCQRPDAFDQWDSKLGFFGTRLTNLGLNGLNVLTGADNAPVDFAGSFSFQDWQAIRAMKFGERADSTVVAEALDGFYYDVAQCGECGTPSDGCNAMYILTAANSGSPGLSGQFVYSLDKGATWASVDIPTLGGLSGNRAAAMGDKAVVVSQATGSHHWSRFSSINAGTVAWTAVTGYVSTKGPRAIYVKSSNQAFIAAAGGYIYYLTSATATPSVLTDGSVSTQDLNDIAGFGNTIIAVGGSNALLVSSNSGSTFSLVTGPAVGVNLTCCWAMNNTIWLIGTGNGKLYYTLNSGSTWTEIKLSSTATVINDIRFVNDVVGYLCAEVAGVATVFRTTDSGNSWQNTAPHISSLPTAVRVNFCYPCGINQVLVGGRKTVGGDGLVALAN